MTILKGRSAEAFLARFEPPAAAILLFGQDQGLVAERAAQLVKRILGEAADDPFCAPVLTGESIATDPLRLADEVYAVPLFGGRKVVRVRSATDAIAPALASILRSPTEDAVVVVEAGDLKGGSALRKLVEQASNAVAVPCYHDGEAELGRLIEAELAQVGARIAPAARGLLIGLLGGDRAASRAELQKLALYAMGSATIEETDVLAALGDASLLEIDDIVDAAFDNRVNEVATGFRRLVAAGVDPASIASAALRRVDSLARLKAKVQLGTSLEAALSALRPPLFPKRREVFGKAARRWTAASLERVAQGLRDAVLLTRERPNLAATGVERVMLAVATSGRD